MRTIAPSLNRDALDVAAGEFHRWLGAALFVLAAFAHWIAGAQPAHALLRRAESQLKKLIFARAARQLGPRRARATPCPHGAPNGFRTAQNRDSALRALTRNALPTLARLGVAARVARIAHVFANLNRFVTRLLKRLRRNSVGARLIAVAPPALAFAIAAPTRVTAFADTS